MFNARTDTTPGDLVRFKNDVRPQAEQPTGEVLGHRDGLVLVRMKHPVTKYRSAEVEVEGAYDESFLELVTPN